MTKQFYTRSISCKMYYKEGYFDHEIVKLDNLRQELILFKNTNCYIQSFIDYIKHNVINKTFQI
jgi:hypothetical protein